MDCFMQMIINVVHAQDHRLGIDLCLVQRRHFPGVKGEHIGVERLDLLHGLQRVHFQNKKVADVVRPFRVHSARDGAAAGEGNGGDEKILVVAQRIVGNVARQLGREHFPSRVDGSRVAHPQEIVLIHILRVGVVPAGRFAMNVFHVSKLLFADRCAHFLALLSKQFYHKSNDSAII